MVQRHALNRAWYVNLHLGWWIYIYFFLCVYV